MKFILWIYSLFCFHKWKHKSNVQQDLSEQNGVGSVEQCENCDKFRLNKKKIKKDKWRW